MSIFGGEIYTVRVQIVAKQIISRNYGKYFAIITLV